MKLSSHYAKTPASRTNAIQRVGQSTKTIVNNRPQAIAQRKLQEEIDRRNPSVNSNSQLIQRVPVQDTNGKWQSTFNSITKEFDSEFDCQLAESALFVKGNSVAGKLKKLRRPTLYTYLSDGELSNVLTKKNQGPHTVAATYSATNGPNPDSVTKESMQEMFDQQVRSLADFDTATADYKAKASVSKLAKLAVAREHYADHIKFIDTILAQTAPSKKNLKYVYDRIRRLMDMDPYATYKWSTQDATPEELAGKGEGRSTDYIDYIDHEWAGDKLLKRKEMHKFLYKRKSFTPKAKFDLDAYGKQSKKKRHAVLEARRKAGKVDPTGYESA